MNSNSAGAAGTAVRIALGTAQLGLAYGVSNRAGQPRLEAAAQIVRQARGGGCDTLDTAMAYGDSEARLGQIGVGDWRVVSKLPAFAPATPDLKTWVRGQVTGSLERLRLPGLYALLLHDPSQLSGPRGDELFAALRLLKEDGLVHRIGVSIYAPGELEALLRYRLDLVQAPFNVVDRALPSGGWAARLADAGVEIHLRSIFLQGLLLMPPSARPSYFEPWKANLRTWDAWLRATGLTALQACVRHALAQPFAQRVVVGVASGEELAQVMAAAVAAGELPPLPEGLHSDDPGLVNPSTWKIK